MRERSRFLRSVQVQGRSAIVLLRMARGDLLVEYPSRKFLHSCDPMDHPTMEIRSQTICALMIKGLIFPASFEFNNDGQRKYEITDEGRSVVKLIRGRQMEQLMEGLGE